MRAATRLDEPVEACLVTVKATHLGAALERVPAAALDGALLVPFLNGIEHLALLRDRYPAATVAAAAIPVESMRVTPGVIEQVSPSAMLELVGGDERVEALARRLRAAGLDVAVRDDEAAVLWTKLAFLWRRSRWSPRTPAPRSGWRVPSGATTSPRSWARWPRWPARTGWQSTRRPSSDARNA